MAGPHRFDAPALQAQQRVPKVTAGAYLDATGPSVARASMERPRFSAPAQEAPPLGQRLPFPQAAGYQAPLPASRVQRLPEGLGEATEAQVAVTTRPLQPKLPSDRKSPTAMSERRGDPRIEPSPGGSSATYSSPAGDANSPAFLLKAARGPPLQDDDERPEGEMPFALLAGAGGDSAQNGALWPTPAPAPTTFRGAEFPAPSVDAEETAYLRRNVEHLRFAKRRLEERVQDLRTRCEQLEQRKQQYKLLYEQQQQQLRDQQAMVGGSEEISQLHQQLSAISLLKDALNQENLDLARRLEESERHRLNREAEPVPQASCVICLDNLANLVTLPCKHLAMCTFCGFQEDLTECPICRTRIGEKMQIFTDRKSVV